VPGAVAQAADQRLPSAERAAERRPQLEPVRAGEQRRQRLDRMAGGLGQTPIGREGLECSFDVPDDASLIRTRTMDR
jgi:hypothetical protein